MNFVWAGKNDRFSPSTSKHSITGPFMSVDLTFKYVANNLLNAAKKIGF